MGMRASFRLPWLEGAKNLGTEPTDVGLVSRDQDQPVLLGRGLTY